MEPMRWGNGKMLVDFFGFSVFFFFLNCNFKGTFRFFCVFSFFVVSLVLVLSFLKYVHVFWKDIFEMFVRLLVCCLDFFSLWSC